MYFPCFLMVFVMLLGGCQAHDAQYYQQHAQALQAAVDACPQKQPRNISCEALMALATRMNQLGLELQQSPQAFGRKILALQEKIAREQADTAALTKDQAILQEYMATVKWLESPVG